jgi:hypothetical protein
MKVSCWVFRSNSMYSGHTNNIITVRGREFRHSTSPSDSLVGGTLRQVTAVRTSKFSYSDRVLNVPGERLLKWEPRPFMRPRRFLPGFAENADELIIHIN